MSNKKSPVKKRPDNVPPDWLLRDCMNPLCRQLVWVPPFVQHGLVDGTPILGVCSADCAKAVTLSRDPDD